MTRENFAQPYLVALYKEHRREPSDRPSIAQLIQRYRLPRDSYFEGELYEHLTVHGWASSRDGGASILETPLIITFSGKTLAERWLDNGIDPQRNDEVSNPITEANKPTTVKTEQSTNESDPSVAEFLVIPASDRMVRIDHNSVEFATLQEKSNELISHLQKANDIGELSVEEAEVAVSEIQQLKGALQTKTVRQNTILQMTVRTLRWVGIKGGEAVVGTLAIGLMVLVFAYFGIVIPG